MTPALYWRIGLVLALAAGAWFVYHTVQQNAVLRERADIFARQIDTLQKRAAALEAMRVENQKFDTETDTQASRGIARNESARRSNSDVIAIDKPWPAAVRGRVFANPDPTSGSTEPAGHAGAGGSGRDEVPQP
jgi:hypothetical protein